MMFSTAVRYGIRWNCWKTNPIFSARTRFNSEDEIPATFCPSSQISPDDGWSRHPIRLTRVDLPEPDGPMIDSHSPGVTCSEMWSSAWMELAPLSLPVPLPAAFAG